MSETPSYFNYLLSMAEGSDSTKTEPKKLLRQEPLSTGLWWQTGEGNSPQEKAELKRTLPPTLKGNGKDIAVRGRQRAKSAVVVAALPPVMRPRGRSQSPRKKPQWGCKSRSSSLAPCGSVRAAGKVGPLSPIVISSSSNGSPPSVTQKVAKEILLIDPPCFEVPPVQSSQNTPPMTLKAIPLTTIFPSTMPLKKRKIPEVLESLKRHYYFSSSSTSNSSDSSTETNVVSASLRKNMGKKATKSKDWSSLRDAESLEWVSDEVKGIISTCGTTETAKELFAGINLTPEKKQDDEWRLAAVPKDERICSARSDEHSTHYLMMYSYYFLHLGLRLPFSEFVIDLLNQIDCAPSQLHPNAWAFILVYEMLCSAYQLTPSSPSFLCLYHLFGQRKSWLSFRKNKKFDFCDVYGKKIHQWNREYFKLFAVENTHPFFLDRETKRPLFPLYWVEEPDYGRRTYFSYEDLSQEEKRTVDRLCAIAYGATEGGMLSAAQILHECDVTYVKAILESQMDANEMKRAKMQKFFAAQKLVAGETVPPVDVETQEKVEKEVTPPCDTPDADMGEDAGSPTPQDEVPHVETSKRTKKKASRKRKADEAFRQQEDARWGPNWGLPRSVINRGRDDLGPRLANMSMEEVCEELGNFGAWMHRGCAMTGAIAYFREAVGSLRFDLKERKDEQEQLLGAYKQLESEKGEADKLVAEKEASLTLKDEEIASLKMEMNTLSEQKEEVDKQLQTAEEKLGSLEVEKKKLEDDVEQLRKDWIEEAASTGQNIIEQVQLLYPQLDLRYVHHTHSVVNNQLVRLNPQTGEEEFVMPTADDIAEATRSVP